MSDEPSGGFQLRRKLPSWAGDVVATVALAAVTGAWGMLLSHDRSIATNQANINNLQGGQTTIGQRLDRMDEKLDRLLERPSR